ncbi:MAG: tRNA pseudouridine(38-40) synthase TruA [Bacteroidota bacterium]
MPRYFIEVSYKGTNYSGFQLQHNANTIQAEVEKAFDILQKEKITMTGSSRTDAGVHAQKNFFHFDFEETINPHFIYKMNAILPADIVVKNLIRTPPEAHCRFDAISREYNYYIYNQKDPFRNDRAFFFPYKLDREKMQQAALIIKEHNDFTSFSKRKTQVRNFNCNIISSKWVFEADSLVYKIKANRFLRGMVRGLTATMLKIGRNKLSLKEFNNIIIAKDCTKASFAVPAHGLFLINIEYPAKYFVE